MHPAAIVVPVVGLVVLGIAGAIGFVLFWRKRNPKNKPLSSDTKVPNDSHVHNGSMESIYAQIGSEQGVDNGEYIHTVTPPADTAERPSAFQPQPASDINEGRLPSCSGLTPPGLPPTDDWHNSLPSVYLTMANKSSVPVENGGNGDPVFTVMDRVSPMPVPFAGKQEPVTSMPQLHWSSNGVGTGDRQSMPPMHPPPQPCATADRATSTLPRNAALFSVPNGGGQLEVPHTDAPSLPHRPATLFPYANMPQVHEASEEFDEVYLTLPQSGQPPPSQAPASPDVPPDSATSYMSMQEQQQQHPQQQPQQHEVQRQSQDRDDGVEFIASADTEISVRL